MEHQSGDALTRAQDGKWIDISGIVSRLLHDDHDDSRHQRFIVNVADGKTVLVAHNLDIAERVPVGIGDRVSVRGLYEWSPLGGLLHWTHHDPHGELDGGYIRLRSDTYA